MLESLRVICKWRMGVSEEGSQVIVGCKILEERVADLFFMRTEWMI